MAKALMDEHTTNNELRDVLNEHVVLTLVEGADEKSGKIMVRGEFGHAEKATANGRLYPSKLWEAQIERLEDSMKSRKVLGELDHPADGRTSLKRVSHIITDLKVEDGRVIGEAELLDTALGRDLRAILEAGVPVGISSRGYGSTKADGKGNEVVQEDYKLVTFDFVAEPADSTAYPDVFFEGVEFPMGQKSDEELAAAFADKVQGEAPEDELAAKFVATGEQPVEGARMSEEAREMITSSMLQAIGEQRGEVEAEVEARLLADPKVAAAKTTLESILELVRPFMLSEDTAAIVAERDDEISKLQKQLAEQELKLTEKDELIERLGNAVKETGYKFQMERLIDADADAGFIRESIGDVTQFDSASALEEAIGSVKARLAERREAEEAARAEQREEDRKLQAKTSQLAEGLEDALHSNRELALELYAEKRLRHHANADQIRAVLEHTSLTSTDQIDDLLEQFREVEKDPSDLEAIRDRVRNTLGGGRESIPEDRQERGRRGRAENYNGLGTSLTELRSLSGLPDRG